MNTVFILDACALIAFLQKETGWEQVREILLRARENKIIVRMHVFNLLEVYYDMYRSIGKHKANEELNMIKRLPITFNTSLSDDIFIEAGRLKATYKISLADAVVLAQTIVADGTAVTSDHHEFDIIESKESVKFLWIR